MSGKCSRCGCTLLATMTECPYCRTARGPVASLAPTGSTSSPVPALPAPGSLDSYRPPERVAPSEPAYEGPLPRPWAAALLSLLFPGAGQAYCGHVGAGVAIGLTWWLVPVVSNVAAAIHAAGAAVRAARLHREPVLHWPVAIPAFQVLIQVPVLVMVLMSFRDAERAREAREDLDRTIAQSLPEPEAMRGILEGLLGDDEAIASGAQELSAEGLDRLRAGTVLIAVAQGNGYLSEGSGFVVDADGLVVTNAHVVDYGRAPAIFVVVNSGRPDAVVCRAVVAYSTRGPIVDTGKATIEEASLDIAVLRIESPVPLRPLEVGSSRVVQETTEVIGVGFPLGTRLSGGSSGPPPSFVRGAVSRFHRDDFGRTILIEHTAPLESGNSGGPLVTTSGLVVGVNVGTAGSQIGAAVPAERVTEALAQMAER